MSRKKNICFGRKHMYIVCYLHTKIIESILQTSDEKLVQMIRKKGL